MAKILNESFPDSILEYCTVKRESSNNKANKLKNHLKKFPRSLLDFLRIVEAKFFFNSKKIINIDKFLLPSGIENFSNILIIDDAIDTGATLNALINELRHRNKSVEIKTAVFTVTLDKPCFRPDFYLFDNNTLLRFPWSKDF